MSTVDDRHDSPWETTISESYLLVHHVGGYPKWCASGLVAFAYSRLFYWCLNIGLIWNINLNI
jgi:hypothetical protein